MINTSIRLYTYSIILVFLCLLNICVALGFFVISVRIVEILQSSFTLPLSLLFFHVCWVFLLHWGFANNVWVSKAMVPPLQALKHFKFKLFFNVELNHSIESMAHVGSNSYQGVFSSILESIIIIIKVCLCSSTNPKSSRSFGMESLNSLEPLVEKKPKRFYEKTRVFQNTRACHFHEQNLSLGMMGWFFKFDALSTIRF